MTATPQDHKSKTYSFTHDGKTYTIPAFGSLPMGVLRKSRKAKDEADQAFIIIETVMGEDSPELAAVDSMTATEFGDWLQGWTQGAAVGESLGSEN
jgi:hypothetical protein